MVDRIKRYRRRSFYSVLVVAFVALAIPISYAVAGGGGTVVSPVEKHNDDCGDSQGKKVIGTDTFKRSGDTLYVTHKVSGADPGRHTTCTSTTRALLAATTSVTSAISRSTEAVTAASPGVGTLAAPPGTSSSAITTTTTTRYDCGLTVQLGPDESLITRHNTLGAPTAERRATRGSLSPRGSRGNLTLGSRGASS